jgi:hypothetical protein
VALQRETDTRFIIFHFTRLKTGYKQNEQTIVNIARVNKKTVLKTTKMHYYYYHYYHYYYYYYYYYHHHHYHYYYSSWSI